MKTSAFKLTRLFTAIITVTVTAFSPVQAAPLPLDIQYMVDGDDIGSETKSTVVSNAKLLSIKQYMPYEEARTLLIEEGWQPINNLPNRQESRGFRVDDIAKKKGFWEVKDCSGTGWGFCRFEFSNTTGHKIVIISFGEELLLSNWFLEENELKSNELNAEDKNIYNLDIPTVEKGMSYEAARTLLLDQGWYGFIGSSPAHKLQNPSMSHLSQEKGFLEVAECSEAKPITCRFEFGSATGQELSIITLNNEPGQEPIVSDIRGFE